MMSWQNSRQPS